MKPGYVYALKSESGKRYIGSTENVTKRLEIHYYQLRTGKHHNLNLQAAYDAGDKFKIDFITCPDRKYAYELEEKLIKRYAARGQLFNIGLNSFGGDNLTLHPDREDIITRRSESQKAYFTAMSPEERHAHFEYVRGENNGMFGRNHTDEVKEASRQRNLGRVPPNKGIPMPDEQKAILSEIASKRTGDRNHFFGRHHSEETKAKLKLLNIGRQPPNCKKISVDGVSYSSLHDASRKLGIHATTILHRVNSKNPKFSGYVAE